MKTFILKYFPLQKHNKSFPEHVIHHFEECQIVKSVLGLLQPLYSLSFLFRNIFIFFSKECNFIDCPPIKLASLFIQQQFCVNDITSEQLCLQPLQ